MTRIAPILTLEALMSRQRLIAGWDARREPRVAMISTGPGGDLGPVVSLALAGLGARHQIVQCDEAGSGEPMPGLWRHVRAWLDDATLSWRGVSASSGVMACLMRSQGVDVYVDATGRCAAGMEAAAALGVPAYSVTALWHRVRAGGAAPAAWRRKGPAAPEACLFAAGVVAGDFVLRRLLGRRGSIRPSRRVSFDVSNPWKAGGPLPARLRPLPRPLRLLLAGAGGLGCPAALALARMLPEGSRVVVADADRVEPSNRNRQFLFSGADAAARAPKAEAACRRLRAVRGEVEWVPLTVNLPHPAAQAHGPYDAVLTMTDTLRSRVEIDRAGLAPVVVHAGTSIRGANAALFHAGGPRLSDVMAASAAMEGPAARASCGGAQPSIITTNLVGAALAVSLLRRHIMRGPEPARTFCYDPAAPALGGAFPPFLPTAVEEVA